MTRVSATERTVGAAPDDPHPRIEQASDGHARIRGTRVKVETVLRALAHTSPPAPPAISTMTGRVIETADIAAALNYTADILEHIQKLYAELARLREALPTRKKEES